MFDALVAAVADPIQVVEQVRIRQMAHQLLRLVEQPVAALQPTVLQSEPSVPPFLPTKEESQLTGYHNNSTNNPLNVRSLVGSTLLEELGEHNSVDSVHGDPASKSAYRSVSSTDNCQPKKVPLWQLFGDAVVVDENENLTPNEGRTRRRRDGVDVRAEDASCDGDGPASVQCPLFSDSDDSSVESLHSASVSSSSNGSGGYSRNTVVSKRTVSHGGRDISVEKLSKEEIFELCMAAAFAVQCV
ncbi:MAG: hypothetical protein MHM6MM_007566 [Cercozoa sp. M6MM]